MVKPVVTVDSAFGISYTLINALDDHTEFTNSAGTITTEVGAGPFGEDVIRQQANTDTGTPGSLQIGTIPADLYQDGLFSVAVKTNDFTGYSKFLCYFYRSPATASGNYLYGDQFGKGTEYEKLKSGEWIRAQWRGVNFAAGGGAPAFDSNTADLEKINVKLQTETGDGTGCQLDWSHLRGNVKHNKAIVILSFDDSNDTNYTKAFPELSSRGFKGVDYTIPTFVGQANRTTIAQLTEMQVAGWDIASHGETALTTLTAGEQITELTAVKSWMQTNGFAGWDHYAYPLGKHDANALDALESLGFKTARTVEVNGWYCLDKGYPLYLTKGYGTSQSTTADGVSDSAILTSKLDEVIAGGGIQEFWCHQLQDAAPTLASGHTHLSAYNTFLDYLKTKVDSGEVEVVTKSQLYAESQGVEWRGQYSDVVYANWSVGSQPAPPTWDSTIPDQLMETGTPIAPVNVQVASDTTGDITYSVSSLASGFTFDGSGNLYADATVVPGTYPITVTATNIVGSINQTFDWVVASQLAEFDISVDSSTGIATLQVDTDVIDGTMYLRTYDTDPGVVTAQSVIDNSTDSQVVVSNRVTFTIPGGGFGDTDYYAVVQQVI